MAPGREPVWQPDASGSPFGLAGGAAAMIGATALAAALFPAAQQPARLVVVALAAGGCAATIADTRVTLAVAGIGYLLFTGFLVNSRGELTWDGVTSLAHLLAFGTASGIGLTHRWIRTVRADVAFDAALRELLAAGQAGDDDRRFPE